MRSYCTLLYQLEHFSSIGRVVGFEMIRWRFSKKIWLGGSVVTGVTAFDRPCTRYTVHCAHSSAQGGGAIQTTRRDRPARIGAFGPHTTLPSIFPHRPQPGNTLDLEPLHSLRNSAVVDNPVQYSFEIVGDRKRTMKYGNLLYYQMKLQ